MVQHLLLGMLGPLGLVTGAPVTLLLGASPRSAGRAVTRVLRSRVFHVVGHPVTAAALHVGGLFVLYLTPLYAVSAQQGAVHHLVHVHFLAAGYLFAWAVAGPDPAPRRPGLGVRVTVLVLAAGAHSYLGKLLYAGAGELPPGAGHSAAETEAAAQLMYYGGDVVELLLATALFWGWYRRAGRSLPRRLQGA
jgi:putative membrane protein